jgi:hypothetical protein
MDWRLALFLGVFCVGLITGCGDDESVCARALDKINECRAAMNPPADKLRFPAECSDKVEMKGSTGMETVALKSWSQEYLDCENIDPQTCNCPALGSWFDYRP